MYGFKMFKKAPEIAECHSVRPYTREYPGPMSRYLPGVQLEHTERLVCPACEYEQKMPEHGEHTGCEKCDLLWVRFAAGLYIWRDGPRLRLVDNQQTRNET